MSDAVLGWIIILTLIIGIGYIVKKRINAKKKTGSYGLGCLITIIVVIGILAIVGVVAYNGYKEAEIKYGIKTAEEKYLSNIKNYKNFSNREAKELSIKLFLLDRCEGGQKAIDKMRDFDSNAEIYSCMELLRLNIKKENLPSSKTELEVLKYLNTVNFGKALDNYKNFINE
jgi:Tfp pilus assembly major pilin PilA